MNKRYLPIGSVVNLKGNGKSLMITGYYSVEYENGLEIYDYSGCAYPEGIMIKSYYCSFNHKDIDNVLFEGYKTDEYTKLTDNLNNLDKEIVDGDIEYFDDKKIEIDTLDDDFVLPHYEFDDDGIIIK